MGVQFPEKLRYVTLEWPLMRVECFLQLLDSFIYLGSFIMFIYYFSRYSGVHR